MERRAEVRRLTSAERHRNRVLGRPDVEEVEVDVTSSADLHAERLTAPRKSEKPKNMETSTWYALRAQGEDGPPAA